MARGVPSIKRFYQNTASSIWTIQHNLGSPLNDGVPIVDVYVIEDDVEKKILPSEIVKVDKNTVEIRFSQQRIGFAIVLI